MLNFRSAIRRLVSEGFHKRDAAEALYSVYEMNEYDPLWRMPRLTSRGESLCSLDQSNVDGSP